MELSRIRFQPSLRQTRKAIKIYYLSRYSRRRYAFAFSWFCCARMLIYILFIYSIPFSLSAFRHHDGYTPKQIFFHKIREAALKM